MFFQAALFYSAVSKPHACFRVWTGFQRDPPSSQVHSELQAGVRRGEECPLLSPSCESGVRGG